VLTTYETGFYRERISGESETNAVYNEILEVDPLTSYDPELNRGLIGARFIGRRVNDGTGTFISQSDYDLLITGPFNSIYDPWGFPPLGDTNTNGGTSYMVRFNPVEGLGGRRLPKYYQPSTDFSPANYLDITPVQPHQYLVGGYSHSGMAPGSHAGLHYDTDFNPAAIRILGDEEEMIQNVVGIPDFNEDRRTDIAVGAPLADVNRDGHPDGAVYIVYRRAPSLEGDYRLRNLKLPTNNVERLSGVLVREAYGEGAALRRIRGRGLRLQHRRCGRRRGRQSGRQQTGRGHPRHG
jgi:hypothetical protein